MVTKRKNTRYVKDIEEQKQHELDALNKRLNDSEGNRSFPEWPANPVADDMNAKFVMTFWGSLFIPVNDKPVDLYMIFDSDKNCPVFLTVAGNTACDVRTLQKKDGDMYQTLLQAVSLLDHMLLSYYTKPNEE